MAFKDTLASYRRLAILRFLYKSPSYQANSLILKDVLNDNGYMTTIDDLRNDASFLTEKKVVDIENFEDHANMFVFILTGKGEEVAKGLQIVEGIKRPTAGDNIAEL